MTDENLTEFLNERVLATRQCHHVQYPVDLDTPGVAVALDCPEDAMTVVVLPTFVRGLAHFEIHCFADGERIDPEIAAVSNGCVELTFAKPQPTV